MIKAINDGLTTNQRYYKKHKQLIRTNNDLLASIRLVKNINDEQFKRLIKALNYYHTNKDNSYIDQLLNKLAKNQLK